MSDIDLKRKGIALLMELVSAGEWKHDSSAAIDQAQMYLEGIRDGRIADTTFQAVELAIMISRERSFVGR